MLLREGWVGLTTQGIIGPKKFPVWEKLHPGWLADRKHKIFDAVQLLQLRILLDQ